MYYLMLVGLTGDANYGQYNRVGEKFLYFSTKQMNWFKAHSICRTMNGNLASIDNERDWKSISDYLTNNFDNENMWWISANDLDSEGNFDFATTGKSVDYTNWFPEQPDNHGGNEDCVHIHRRNFEAYGMNDYECTGLSYFICELEREPDYELESNIQRYLANDRKRERQRELKHKQERQAKLMDCKNKFLHELEKLLNFFRNI
uniref:C-type lectin domain-containing protein n=1 Tax=Glossina brevipalpis TaxID=37001 RepID=A0A1A9WN43_9MUSC